MSCFAIDFSKLKDKSILSEIEKFECSLGDSEPDLKKFRYAEESMFVQS